MTLLMLALFSPAAHAQTDTPICSGIECIDPEIRYALSDAGLDDPDALALTEDETGQVWLTVTTRDADGLSKVAPKVPAQPVRDTTSWFKTIPMTLKGFEPVPLPIPALPNMIDARKATGGGGGGGGGGQTCDVVCVCTETGSECWVECY